MTSSCSSGDLESVKRLIWFGVDINKKDSNGSTALIQSSLNGHFDIVRELIRAGADVNIKNSREITPLTMAAERGYLNIVGSSRKKYVTLNQD
jgi:ankyrin repeat protein